MPTWLKRLLCGLRGHAAMLHFEPARLALRCPHCGHDSEGWDVEPKRLSFIAPDGD